jgi:hypothetical protein
MDRPLHKNLLIKFFTIPIFGLALCVANGASAQTVHGTLRDVTNLEIAVEPLDSDARSCGVRESALTEAVKKGAEEAGFTLDGYDYALYLRISSLPRESDCFSSIDVDVRYVGKLPLPAYPNGNRVRAVLWSNGTIIISARNEPTGRVARLLRCASIAARRAPCRMDSQVRPMGTTRLIYTTSPRAPRRICCDSLRVPGAPHRPGQNGVE